jgi:hypothetical protein
LGISPATKDPRGDQYAGSQVCASCHAAVFNAYTHNNHNKTSSAVNSDSLKKLIDSSNGDFYFPDSSYIHVEEKDSLFIQEQLLKGKALRSEKIDISFGSAEKAQTYAYWKGSKSFQLPLTWFSSMHTWANSPGFPARRAYFDRVIEARCFECHATYIHKEFVQSGSLKVEEKLDRKTVIYGIGCERCHGPAAVHVQYHKSNPSASRAMYMVSIKSMSRRQQLDVCAACHSGNDQAAMKSLFAFIPGDTLANFYFPDFGNNKAEPDVHGKQMQMLAASLCYQRSEMTCNSCHDAHERETKLEMFITKCMNCHHQSAHALNRLKEQENGLISQNCIDCHMPLQESKTISFNSGAELKQIPYFLRTHRIAVYDNK